jgi:2,4-dienoyl-CoA reductase-like NADH-dependent reductase (Old Yellow Enzyme family)
MAMVHLFEPLRLRSITLPNRIGLSPMCMYASVVEDGRPAAWHMMHLGARAAGGAGLVMTEATAVEARGRISACDVGMWSRCHVTAWRPVVEFIKAQGAVPGVQLAHAGRKAGTAPPWDGGAPYSGGSAWEAVAPSPLPFDTGYQAPRELTVRELEAQIDAWAAATRRAHAAGFEVLELHMAHGYLLHQFLSPLTNQRQDRYGGDLDARMSFPLRIAHTVRLEWPEHLPLFVRISASDWIEGGWDIAQSIVFCQRLKEIGVDVVDCSSGGAVPQAIPPVAPGYQVPAAARIRAEAGIATAAVGLITEPKDAESIIRDGRADIVLLGRAMLADPHWPLHAAQQLGAQAPWPKQYLRAAPAPARNRSEPSSTEEQA